MGSVGYWLLCSNCLAHFETNISRPCMYLSSFVLTRVCVCVCVCGCADFCFVFLVCLTELPSHRHTKCSAAHVYSVNGIQLTGIYVDYVLNCDLLQLLRLISFCAIWMLIFLSAKINWISFIVFQINKFHMKQNENRFVHLSANKNSTGDCFYLWLCAANTHAHSIASRCELDFLFFNFALRKYVCILLYTHYTWQTSHGNCSISLHSLRI